MKWVYRNMQRRMADMGFSAARLAGELGMSAQSLRMKLRGEYDFSLREAIAIKELLRFRQPLEDVFERGTGGFDAKAG